MSSETPFQRMQESIIRLVAVENTVLSAKVVSLTSLKGDKGSAMRYAKAPEDAPQAPIDIKKAADQHKLKSEHSPSRKGS